MDEGTLNDLLECSVCLERLDTSSKVLPCQHTFCKKCLHEIVDSHKELRCPECRVLVPCKVEELPPNVLLMRILEGMRNATPKKADKPARNNSHAAPIIQQSTPAHHGPGTPDHRHKSNKQSSPHQISPHQPYAKALYDFAGNQQGDLAFKRGEIIILRKRIDSHWFEGECGGKKGVFPVTYVQIITPVPSNVPQCKALYDFRMTNDDEEGCLTFSKGDIISVIRRVDENWAEGNLDGRIGIFPLAFVELNSLARSLMKLSTNVQPGPSRVAPPTPTTEDSAPLIPIDHSRNVANVPIQPAVATPKHASAAPAANNVLPASDSSSTVSSGASSTTTTPNTSSSNTSSTSSTAPSSPASPPPRATPNRVVQKLETSLVSTPTRHATPPARPEAHSSHHNKEKRHSFTSLTPSAHHSNRHRHSAELLGDELERAQAQAQSSHSERERHRRVPSDTTANLQLPAAYVALYPYKPQKQDELELRKNGIYMVSERCQDGWFKGTSTRTQKCGVFPGNYVAPYHNGAKTSASGDSKTGVSYSRKSGTRSNNLPPELPPRSTSPTANTISSSWHGQQDNATVPLGRSSSAIMSSVNLTVTPAKASEKHKDKKEKGVSLMRRLTSIKRSKSPPASSYSMDNPVFEDGGTVVSTLHPVHVRSGGGESPAVSSSTSSPNIHQHRKSHSLDATGGGNGKSKTSTQTVRERFRCIAPYPPNSEYELELQVNDIIYVHKKREDGWYKGTQQRTGRTGLFPASFVDSF